MAKVEQEIVVRIKTIVDGLNQVKSYSDTIKNLGSGGSASLAQNFIKAGSAAGITNQIVGRTVDLLEELGSVGVRAFAGFVEEGIRFNTVIESARIGIATLVANTYDVKDENGNLVTGMDAFNAALEKSDELERALQKSAIETKFEFADILTFFNSTVIASAGLKTNLDQLVRLTQDFALAAGAANVETEKVNTGIQQILTGIVTVRNPLARVLFPGQTTKDINEALKKEKEAGTLVDFLEEKLKVFRLSADTVGQSMEAVASNTTDALKVFEALATHPLFNSIKETLGFIIKQIVDLSGDTVKLTPTFQKIADIIAAILGAIGDHLVSDVKAIATYLDEWVNSSTASESEFRSIGDNLSHIAEQLAGILIDLGVATGRITDANSGASNFGIALAFVGGAIAAIRSLLEIVYGIITTIVGVVGFSLLSVVSAVADVVQSLTGKFESAANAARGLRDVFLDILNNGANTLSHPFKAFGELANGFAGDGKARHNEGVPGGDFSFSPHKFPAAGGKGAGGGGRKGSADQRLRDAQRLFDEIEKYQIANARREVELNEQVNKQVLKGWQRRFDQGVISAESFYKKKAQLEFADLAQQEAALKQEKGFADQALARDLGAIVGKFKLTPDAVEGLKATLGGILDSGDVAGASAKTIKQALAYQKYLEQTAAITQKLNKIQNERAASLIEGNNAIKDATLANKLMLDSLGAELAASQGNSGLGELFELQKRVSDELPKVLSEFDSAIPGMERVSQLIKDSKELDITGVLKIFSEARLKVDDLSEQARVFIKLLERLQDLAKIKSIQSAVLQAQDQFRTSNTGTQTDFDAGKLTLAQALTQSEQTRTTAVAALNAAYSEQLATLQQMQADGIATPQDLADLVNFKRAVDALTSSYIDLSLVQKQEDRDDNKLATATAEVEARRRAGEITGQQAHREINDLQQQRIAAYQQEIADLQALTDQNYAVVTATAEAKVKLAEMRNEANSDALNFASNVNGIIGGSIQGFISDIISGTESIGDAFRKLISGLLTQIANAIIQALVLKFILGPLGLAPGDTGGGGGWLGRLLGLAGGVVGGTVGGGGGSTTGTSGGLTSGVNGGFFPDTFADGGILRGRGTGVSDSIVIAASHGEGIIPARRVAQYGSSLIQSIIDGSFLPQMSFAGFAGGGFPSGAIHGGGKRGTRVINSIHPDLIKDYLNSADGEDIILNVIGKNPGVVQRLVN